MPGGKRKGEDAIGLDSFFDEVNKSEEVAIKKQKVEPTDADMDSFFGAVNQSEQALRKREKRQSPAQQHEHRHQHQHREENKKPAPAAHHAPLDFDDVVLPSEETFIGVPHTAYSMPGQLSTSIGSGVGLQQQNIGENVGRINEKGTGAAPIRMAAGKKWRDESLLEWPENDYRLFVGNLDKETKLEQLEKVFTHYCSFAKAKLVMNNFPEKGTNRYMCKGYGFVSFLDPMDCAKALRTENGKYCGLRPMQLKKSNWEARNKEEQVKAKMDAKKRGF